MGRVDELIQQLESGDVRARREAARELGDYRDPRVVDALIRLRVRRRDMRYVTNLWRYR